MKKLFQMRNSDVPLTSDICPLTSGFTLIEMLIVILIIAILMSVGFGTFSQARNTAWKEKARDTARQIAHAWTSRLMEDHAFPSVSSGFDGTLTGGQAEPTFQTTVANMCVLTNNADAHNYLEQNATQRTSGMTDHWGNYFYVRLDGDYDGIVLSPIDNTSQIHASVLVWSLGPNQAAWATTATTSLKQKHWVMIWQ